MSAKLLDIVSGLRDRHSLKVVIQSEATECGLACLTMVARYLGQDVTLSGLRRRFPISMSGATLSRVAEIARAVGLTARGLKVELNSLHQTRMPCILHWDMNHFVVLGGIKNQVAEIHDPARGFYRMPMDEVSKHFTGVVLELACDPAFVASPQKEYVSLRQLTGRISGLTRTSLQIFGLALAIEILGLTLPFQMQWVIDQVLPTSDKNLLWIVGLGFAVIILAQATLSVARGWVISWLGATLSAQWISNLFRHLLKLPLDFFEKRHIGDVVSRFGSIRSIQSTLTGSFFDTVLSGFMGLLALVMLTFYSPQLTCLIVAVFLIYGSLRALAFHKQRQFNEEQLIYRSRQDSELMESVRGVRTIKLANKQDQRVERLINATIESARRDLQIQRMTLTFSAINQGLFGMQRVLLIALGAWFCIDGRFSAGMIVSYLAFADQFATKIGNVIDKGVELKMLRLHAERIADIALSDPEQHEHGIYSGPEPKADLSIKNLSYRYAEGEPWVLRDLNLEIKAGTSVAIVGPSGCGKTTLAKLLLGLLQPVEGTIAVGGLEIRSFGLHNYRGMTAAVLQDDQLFAGSIADNISFFDESAKLQDIQEAAKLASIHADIAAMPMGYETMVGDMGSTLSGGQKQRVILARALFRKPKLIVLDEATSHLDIQNEYVINAAIKKLNVTRVIIAHRLETIASADYVLRLEDGRIAKSELIQSEARAT